jgi:hypothetical protein
MGSGHTPDHERVARLLPPEAASEPERRRWGTLILLLAHLDPPPDHEREFPEFVERQSRLRDAIEDGDGEALEERSLALYAHLHGHDARYRAVERRVVDESGGYWAHAGGLSPVLKAPDWLRPDSVSIDYGAASGLQGLLMQVLAPHVRLIQVEISERAARTGQRLQEWLGIPASRVEWRVEDVREAVRGGETCDFIYLYRPVRPEGPGRVFYERLGAKLASETSAVTIFSIADALAPFLPVGFEVVHSDGHLTCFHRPAPSGSRES